MTGLGNRTVLIFLTGAMYKSYTREKFIVNTLVGIIHKIHVIELVAERSTAMAADQQQRGGEFMGCDRCSNSA